MRCPSFHNCHHTFVNPCYLLKPSQSSNPGFVHQASAAHREGSLSATVGSKCGNQTAHSFRTGRRSVVVQFAWSESLLTFWKYWSVGSKVRAVASAEQVEAAQPSPSLPKKQNLSLAVGTYTLPHPDKVEPSSTQSWLIATIRQHGVTKRS